MLDMLELHMLKVEVAQQYSSINSELPPGVWQRMGLPNNWNEAIRMLMVISREEVMVDSK